MAKRSLTIFVHRASECLTDHLSHGDGLICHSLLQGLVARGHRVFAFTNHDGVAKKPAGMVVQSAWHRVPANSLANWEYAWRAESWFREISRRERIDLVWRMHPFGNGCPTVPRSDGRPLVVGPLFYNWPTDDPALVIGGRPRWGIGIGPAAAPLARRGWAKTLQAASVVICATDRQSEEVRSSTSARVATLPVIVDPPEDLEADSCLAAAGGVVQLTFVANLVRNKRPDVFCELVATLRSLGIDARGTVIGDGPERLSLQAWCAAKNLHGFVEFVGRIGHAEVYRRVAGGDLLVSTSRGEPYGRGIVEAMSVGVPAACHRSGGPADLIADGVDGILIDELTANAYARRIAAVATSGRLHALGRAARSKSAAWRPGPVLDRLEELLLAAVGGKDGGR